MSASLNGQEAGSVTAASPACIYLGAGVPEKTRTEGRAKGVVPEHINAVTCRRRYQRRSPGIKVGRPSVIADASLGRNPSVRGEV